MRYLGIAIKKNELWYSVVDGTQMETAQIYETGKQVFRVESETLMTDFNNIFFELLVKYKPQKVICKVSLDVNIYQIPYLHCSIGVLNLICLQNGVEFQTRSSKWITANKRGKIDRVKNFFQGKQFKDDEMAATLIAWYALGE